METLGLAGLFHSLVIDLTDGTAEYNDTHYRLSLFYDLAFQRALYFSSTLQGIMLMFSTYPKNFELDAVKAQVIAQFCNESLRLCICY